LGVKSFLETASTRQTKRSLRRTTTASGKIGGRSIEFSNRNHPQIDGLGKNVTLGKHRGVLFLGIKSFLKTAFHRGHNSHLAHASYLHGLRLK